MSSEDARRRSLVPHIFTSRTDAERHREQDEIRRCKTGIHNSAFGYPSDCIASANPANAARDDRFRRHNEESKRLASRPGKDGEKARNAFNRTPMGQSIKQYSKEKNKRKVTPEDARRERIPREHAQHNYPGYQTKEMSVGHDIRIQQLKRSEELKRGKGHAERKHHGSSSRRPRRH